MFFPKRYVNPFKNSFPLYAFRSEDPSKSSVRLGARAPRAPRIYKRIRQNYLNVELDWAIAPALRELYEEGRKQISEPFFQDNPMFDTHPRYFLSGDINARVLGDVTLVMNKPIEAMIRVYSLFMGTYLDLPFVLTLTRKDIQAKFDQDKYLEMWQGPDSPRFKLTEKIGAPVSAYTAWPYLLFFQAKGCRLSPLYFGEEITDRFRKAVDDKDCRATDHDLHWARLKESMASYRTEVISLMENHLGEEFTEFFNVSFSFNGDLFPVEGFNASTDLLVRVSDKNTGVLIGTLFSKKIARMGRTGTKSHLVFTDNKTLKETKVNSEVLNLLELKILRVKVERLTASAA